MIFDFLVTIFATIGISYALHVLIKLPIEAMTGERGGIAKYNQLLRIEEALGEEAAYVGKLAIRGKSL